MNEPRRLSDKIVSAHEQACAQGKRSVAQHLLSALEAELSAFGGRNAEEKREVDEMVTAAYARQRDMDPTA